MDNKKNIVYWQTTCTIEAKKRGFHLITSEIEKAMQTMPAISTGLIHIFIQHTSASLTISENTCHDVALDLETYFNRAVPEHASDYRHTIEGEDDMPAHIKNTLLGTNITIPLKDNRLLLGRWQGIMLCEHRNHAPNRTLILTAQGQEE